MNGRETDPKTVSLLAVYMLSKALAISPLEIYQMPISLVKDLLQVHGVIEQIKSDEMDKVQRQAEAVKRGSKFS